ncbi:MAG: hypothetical protein IJB47_07605 [Oscillospiraceae bacterium]|nr:hypothetical protein [Oscillospiraceae bacterium]
MKRLLLLLLCAALLLSGCALLGSPADPTDPKPTDATKSTAPIDPTDGAPAPTTASDPTDEATEPTDNSAELFDPEQETCIVDGQVRVMGKMLFTPLMGMTAGKYNEYLGHGGGVRLYNAQGTMYGNAVRFLNMKGKAIFEEGKLVGMGPIDNHAGFVSDFVSVESGAPCIVAEYSVDVYNEEEQLYVGAHKYWYALWAVEGKEPVYGILLDQDGYTMDDLIELAKSVTFTEDAFVDEYK